MIGVSPMPPLAPIRSPRPLLLHRFIGGWLTLAYVDVHDATVSTSFCLVAGNIFFSRFSWDEFFGRWIEATIDNTITTRIAVYAEFQRNSAEHILNSAKSSPSAKLGAAHSAGRGPIE
jgi:hypothetical protein